MKRLRKLFYIALILVAVAGLIYTLSLDSSTPVPPPEVEEDTPTVDTVTPEGDVVQVYPFEQLVYTVGDTQLQFVLGEEGRWIWLDDTSFPLDDTLIAQMVTALEDLHYLRAIPFDEDVTAGDYGLAKPWATLTATRGDGEVLTLDIGAQGTDGNYYMLKNGDTSQALVYQADWVETLFEPIYDMMELPALPTLTADILQGLILVAGEHSMALYVADDATGIPSWHYAGDDTLLNLPDLMDTVVEFQLVKCFSFAPSPGAVTICGFDEPEAVVTIAYDGTVEETDLLTLYMGHVSTDAAYRYVRLDNDDTIYLVDATWVDTVLGLLEMK